MAMHVCRDKRDKLIHAWLCHVGKCFGAAAKKTRANLGGMRCWVYMLSNNKRLTYTGTAANIRERLREHYWRRNQFTAKYRITKLVFLEMHPSRESAAKREKQIKGWRREKKHALIETTNPGWLDLSEQFR